MEKLGGVELVLTCAECNHSGGYGPDAAARRERNPIDAFNGTLGQPHPVRVWLQTSRTRSAAAKPISVNMHFEMSDGRYQLEEQANIDPPAQWEAFKAEFGRVAAEGEQGYELKIDFNKDWYNVQLARVSYLRAAYLVAFAQYGYRCILDPTWAHIRQQTQNPKAEIVTGFRKIMLVLLPLRADAGLYDRLKSVPRSVSENAQVHGTQLYWPTDPIYAWDRRG